MNNTEAIIQKVELQCKASGVRLTTKRKQVFAGLLDSGKAVSAYELADYCKQKYGSAMPAMSVYRILDFLKKEQLVHELKLANKYVACSHIACSHAHKVSQFLICDKCQRVEEIIINQSTIENIKQSVENVGYQLLNQQLEMQCLCDQCTTRIN